MSGYLERFDTDLGYWEVVQTDPDASNGAFVWYIAGGAAVCEWEPLTPLSPIMDVNGAEERFGYTRQSFVDQTVRAEFSVEKTTTSRGTSGANYGATLSMRVGSGENEFGYTVAINGGGSLLVYRSTVDGLTFVASEASGISFTTGDVVRLRLTVEGSTPSPGAVVRARAWLASGAEPSAWAVDVTDESAATITTGAFVAVGPYSGATGTIDAFAVSFSEVLIGDVVPASAGDRLRSNISETTGSLLEAVDARAVDASVSEAYTYAQELPATTLVTYREVLRTRDSANADFAYYPQPRQNIVMENQYTGISVLSRLARYYPPRIFDDVVNLGIAVIPAATATDIIDYVLTQWAAANDWLTFEPVPDLRVPMPGLVPSDYGVGTGQVYAATVTIRQDGANRQDALSILRDLLSPFPGTVLRQNSAGNLEIVPASGPDADETPHVTLTTDDLYSVTIGKPNPFDVINRCIVTASGGLEQGEDVAVMQPAWFQIGSIHQFGRSNWFTPPGARLNLQPFDHPTDTTLQEGFTFSTPFNQQKPDLWPISGDAIPAGDGISLVDSSDAPMVTTSWKRMFNDSLVSSGTGSLTIVTEVIPFSGAWVDAFTFSNSSAGSEPPATVTVRAKWNETLQGVELAFADSPRKLETDCLSGCNGWIIEFYLADASVGYTEGTSVSGTFGFVGDDDTTLPADSASGDAVLDSQTALGIVERTINIKGYAFDATTLSQIARGYVIQNITPKVVRELDVSALSGYRVVFDDIGRMIELPNGDVGFLTGVSYTDDFVSKVVRKTATVEVRDLAAAGAIDTLTRYHVMCDGTFWTAEATGLPIAREEQP